MIPTVAKINMRSTLLMVQRECSRLTLVKRKTHEPRAKLVQYFLFEQHSDVEYNV